MPMDEDQKKRLLSGLQSKEAEKIGIDDEAEEGSMEELDENKDGVVDTEDGGAMVALDEEGPVESESEHFDNLAETLDDADLTQLSQDLLDLIEQDLRAREARDKQYAEGLKRTGMGNDAPGGADFDGASRVVHPLLTKAAVDFSARVMKEIFPPEGPAKDKIIGAITKPKVEKARRKTAHMNWQLTEQMPEFRSELEQLTTQVPLGGAQYLKLFQDQRRKRPVAETIYIDDMILPFAASSFLTAERRTHRAFITAKTYADRIRSGMYVDVDLMGDPMPERSESSVANDKIEGKEEDSYNADGLRTIYETSCFLDLEEEDDFRPYLVTIDKSTGRVLAVYRNWLEDDEQREEMMHIVEFPCIPWRGAYPIGLVQLIGGLSAGATGALRALLDSAHINNLPSGMKLATMGGSKGGQNITPAVGQFTEIEGSFGPDADIRKTIMPMPFNPPSPVLFQLLGFLVEAGEGVVQTTFADMSKQRNDMPVGTTLALIEQGMTVFSSIHARLHASMGQVLKILHRINRLNMTEQQVMTDAGELMVRRQDYEGAMDVVPVSDPNIFSEAQRFAQVQAVAQRALGNPLYNQRNVEEMILERLKVPDAKELLVPQPAPQHLNAVNENAAAAMGKPVVAFPEQDHLSHIATHCGFMMSPIFGQSQLVGKTATPILLTHLKEHIAFWYVTQVYEMTSQAAGVEIDQLIDVKDPELTQEFDKLMAIASDQAVNAAPGAFGNAPQIIQQAIQFVQQFQQPPIMDPSAVQAKEVERKSAADQAKQQIDAKKLQIDEQKAAAQQESLQLQHQREERLQHLDETKLTVEQQKAQADQHAKVTERVMQEQGDTQRAEADIAAKRAMNQEDNMTAMQIAAAEIASGEKTALSTGTGINP